MNAAMRGYLVGLFAMLSMLAVGSANAVSAIAAPDTSVVTDAITGIGVVGAIVFGVYVLVKGFHWIRRAL